MIIISHQERILHIADEIVVIAGGRADRSRAPAEEILPKLAGGAARCAAAAVLTKEGGVDDEQASTEELLGAGRRTGSGKPRGRLQHPRGRRLRRRGSPPSTSRSRPKTGQARPRHPHPARARRARRCHIPACVTHGGVDDLVYNDFYVGEGADVTDRGRLRRPRCRRASRPGTTASTASSWTRAPTCSTWKSTWAPARGGGIRSIDPVTGDLPGGGREPWRWTPRRSAAWTPPVRKTKAVLRQGREARHPREAADRRASSRRRRDFVVELNGEDSSVNLVIPLGGAGQLPPGVPLQDRGQRAAARATPSATPSSWATARWTPRRS